MSLSAPVKDRSGLLMQLKKNANATSGLIKKRPAHVAAPLSYAQERLWIMAQLEPNNPIYNMAGAIQLTGTLNSIVLQQSLNTVLHRHQVLRSCFVSEPHQISQKLIKRAELPLQHLDLTEQPQTLIDQTIEQFIRAPFNLSADLPLRALLIRLQKQRYCLVLALHHIVADRWSVSILLQEIAELYSAFKHGIPAALPELSIQYADFAYWQRQQKDSVAKQLSYWQQKLANAPPLLELPTDRPRPIKQRYAGDVLNFNLPQRLSTALTILTKQHNVTLFMLMAGAFSVLLSRYSQQRDITIGYPYAGRNQPQTERLIGFFVNTLVLRCQLNDSLRFSDYLTQLREQALQDQRHADVAFGQLVETLNPERYVGHTPLFQVMLAVQNVPHSTLQLPNLHVSTLALNNHIAQFDLTLFIEPQDGGLQGAFEYNTDLFERATIAAMATQFETLLNAIANSPNSLIKYLSLLSKAEQQALLANDTPHTNTVLVTQLFEQQVLKQADKPAIAFDQQLLSYNELNQRANQLAHYLQARGITKESRVGVSATRSIDLIIALLAVLKSGAAYIPLDPDYPAQRLTYIIDDAEIDCLLTQSTLSEQFKHNNTVFIDTLNLAAYPSTNLQAVDGYNTAYIIYTSGSTGQPKGVFINHANLSHSTLARHHYYTEPLTGFLLLSSFAFDSSVAGIFWTLTQGGCLCLPASAQLTEPTALAQLIQQRHISHLLALPSFYSAILQNADLALLASLTVAIVAGEACSSAVANEHHQKLPNAKFYNEYGPTENTVWSSVYQSTDLETSATLSIGQAIENVQIAIVNEVGDILPTGVSGELCVAGAGIAVGYLKQPRLTAEKFIPHPFANGQRLYRTGDLARYRHDGLLEFLGRIDHQVKIRGFRIELGEIETRLLTHPAIQQAAVIADKQRLIAYVVSQQPLDDAELVQYLKQHLPDYMLPSAFIYLAQLPLTANGKLNRAALPSPEQQRAKTRVFKSPSNQIETTLLAIWQEVLQLQTISVNDNFFALGGHSLAVIQVRSRINEQFAIDMPANTLFAATTITDLATEVLNLQLQQQDDSELAALLQQLNQLSDEEVTALLNA